ncbi:MAG: hypothetical protein E7G82_06325 [Veillonella sp.]|uniref:hypothetical protein n=1 Tax=uncultured Veillonella sp. TaxID=159268 RepID=UPI0028D5CA9B|nr:hypothetical protein [uncultured Veillonella sp.]MDU3878977.1 hypothetical protein [Veillonella sp.]
MRKLDILGIEFIIVSIVLGVILYKLEISKHIIDEDYEYIKKHRIFGNLTKYLTIISIISIVLIDLRFIIYKDYEFIMTYGGGWVVMGLLTICTGFFQKKNSVYFKRGLIAILSILVFIAVYMYAFRDVFF